MSTKQQNKLDPICCLKSRSSDYNVDNLQEFINEFPFWPNIIIQPQDDQTLCLLAVDEPVQHYTKRWKTLERDLNIHFGAVITKKSIANMLHKEGGYCVCKIYPENM